MATSDSATQASFYVSPQGNDAWSGKLAKPNAAKSDGPFATLGAARDAVRQLRTGAASAATSSAPTVVLIRGGVYELSAPVVFTPQDSGSEQAPVIYAAYPGETPILSGGQRITGWTQKQEGLWMAPAPGVKEGKWYFRQLFIDGQRCQRARAPNTGYFYVEGQVSMDNPAAFRYRAGELHPEWAGLGDVEVVDLNKWQQFRMFIKAVDEETRTVTLSRRRMTSSTEADSRYWIENAADALDAPGEWYLNRSEGVVYYRPLPGEQLARIEAIAPRLEQLVVFAGELSPGGAIHDIVLRGLTLGYAEWPLPAEGYTSMQADSEITAAVVATAARSCIIERCVLRHLGQYAVHFGKGSKHNRIVGNEMSDLGGGGVKIGDPSSGVYPNRNMPGTYRWPLTSADYRRAANFPRDEEETSSDNVIADNHIHDLGIVYPGSVGVWIGQSHGNTIAHNEIHDTSFSGISCGWTWGFGPTAARNNIIEFNHIYNIGRGVMSDMGGIYVLGVQPGTVVRNNLIHDVTRDEGPEGYGGWGIYIDATCSEVHVENNVVYRTTDGSLHQNSGQHNTYVNNIFALGGKAQFQRSNAAPQPNFAFERNIVYWKTGDLFRTRTAEGEYTFDYNTYHNAAGGSVAFGASRSGYTQWADWRASGQDIHSIVADPRFAHPEGGDFTLPPDSPALKTGFKPIDMSQVGPRHR